MKTNGIVIAGTHTGVGKTTLTLGLLTLLRKRGLKPQPFKVGPDFIDPGLHTSVAGRPSRNLDSRMMTPRTITEIYIHGYKDADMAVVEGVMGLFDGYDGLTESGSTAHIAKLLGLPVILVIDASLLARSAAAVALGYQKMDPAVRIAGIILNKTGGMLHRQWLITAIEKTTGIPVIGCLPHDPRLTIPERHLGLITAHEKQIPKNYLENLRKLLEQNLDFSRIINISRTATNVLEPSVRIFRTGPEYRDIRIGVPLDRALNFYYQDNLDILHNFGAELLYFKPSEGEPVPPGIDGLYMGGGFPEIYATEISSNQNFLLALKGLTQKRIPIYAECGGLMCLTEAIVDLEGKERKMACLIPAKAVMQEKLAAIGYVKVRNTAANLLGPPGTTFSGHVFHYSTLQYRKKVRHTYLVDFHGNLSPDGITSPSLLASYVHVHFASKPQLARHFLRNCRKRKNRKTP